MKTSLGNRKPENQSHALVIRNRARDWSPAKRGTGKKPKPKNLLDFRTCNFLLIRLASLQDVFALFTGGLAAFIQPSGHPITSGFTRSHPTDSDRPAMDSVGFDSVVQISAFEF